MNSRALLAALGLAFVLVGGLLWWMDRAGEGAEGSSAHSPPATGTGRPATPDDSSASPGPRPESASAPRERSAAADPREAREGDDSAPPGPTGQVLVRARWSETGAPAANVGVRLRPLGGPLSLWSAPSRTDGEGLARFASVEVGWVEARGEGSGVEHGEVRAGERLELELALATGISVSGRVTDRAGHSVSQGTVCRLDDGEWLELVECDASGRYRIDGLAPGSVLAATARDRVPSGAMTLHGAHGERVEFDLQVGDLAGAVLGQVLDAREHPVAHAVIVLEPSPGSVAEQGAGPRRTARCDDDGRFALHGVPLGPCRLSVQSRRFAPTSLELTVAADTRHELLVTVAPGAELAGIVTVDGRPAERAQVLVRAWPGRWSGGALTDANGAYRITGLPPGAHAVFASVVEDGARPLSWSLFDERSRERVASGEVDLVAGRAVIWNAQLPGLRQR